MIIKNIIRSLISIINEIIKLMKLREREYNQTRKEQRLSRVSLIMS